MAATRRERLAAAFGEDDFPGNDGGTAEANRSEAEAGFPFELLSGPGLSEEKAPPIPSRVKTDKESKPDKEPPKKLPRGTATERQLAEIGEALEEKSAQVFMLLSGLAPVTSVYGAENSDKAVAALLSIAKRRPKFLAALSKAADTVDVLEIVKFIGGLVVALQVDMGRMRGDEMPARATGVTNILETYFQDQEDTNTNPAMEFQVPRFVAV